MAPAKVANPPKVPHFSSCVLLGGLGTLAGDFAGSELVLFAVGQGQVLLQDGIDAVGVRIEVPNALGTLPLLVREPALSDDAARMWVRFSDEIEGRIGSGGELEPIRGLANKLPEHAARIAAIAQIIQNASAAEIDIDSLASGIKLANHYAREAMRLFLVGARNADLVLAERLLAWLQHKWTEPAVSLPDIYQRGLNAVGDAATARKLIEILEEHGWVARDNNGAEIKGVRRQTVWRLVQS
jgi:Protein of unknown function (DUF3987)